MRKMKVEIVLIVGIIFFCCWCAYIIIKMIMTQENASVQNTNNQNRLIASQAVISSGTNNPNNHPSFLNNGHIPRMTPPNQNSHKPPGAPPMMLMHPYAAYPPSTSPTYLNPPPSSKLSSIESELYPSSINNIRHNLRLNQHPNSIIEDFQRPRQAEATSPLWQAILPNNNNNNNNHYKQHYHQPNIDANLKQLAWPVKQQPQAMRYPLVGSNSNWSSNRYSGAASDSPWRAQHQFPQTQRIAQPSDSSDSVLEPESSGDQSSDQENHDLEAQDPQAADPNPDDSNSDEEQQRNDGSTSDGSSDHENQPQEEQEDRAGRRSFSEHEEEANEIDAQGRPILSHHTHLINGKPAGKHSRNGNKFETIVNEIEQNEPSSPDYDESEASDEAPASSPAEPAEQAPEENAQDQPQAGSLPDSGDETRLIGRRVLPSRMKKNQLKGNDNADGKGKKRVKKVEQSIDDEPKRKHEKHNHKLKESLTSKQWDDSSGSESPEDEHPKQQSNNGDHESGEGAVASPGQEAYEESNDLTRRKMESESNDDHVDFSDLDLLSDPNDFPFMSPSNADSSSNLSRRRREADSGSSALAESESLRGALFDVIDRIEQKPAGPDSDGIEVELRPPPSEENEPLGGVNQETFANEVNSFNNSHPNSSSLGIKRQDQAPLFMQSLLPVHNGHHYTSEPFNQTTPTSFYNSDATTNMQEPSSGPQQDTRYILDQFDNGTNQNYDQQLTNAPAVATIGLTANSSLQPVAQFYSAAPQQQQQQSDEPISSGGYAGQQYPIGFQQQVPEYQSVAAKLPFHQQQHQHQSHHNFADNEPSHFQPEQVSQIGNVEYDNKNHRLTNPMTLGSKAYSHKKKKSKKKTIDSKKKKKKKLIKKQSSGSKLSKGKSVKKKAASEKGAMKKKKRKLGKKVVKSFKEFKGATKGSKGKKGTGKRGAKKGSLFHKDKGYKKKGFKKAYQKLESGDHKTYFDEFREKDHKKKWKDFKDKHQYSQNKKWAAKDKKRFDQHNLDEMKDKKFKSGGWNKNSASKYRKDYKFKGKMNKLKKKKKKRKKFDKEKKIKKNEVSMGHKRY